MNLITEYQRVSGASVRELSDWLGEDTVRIYEWRAGTRPIPERIAIVLRIALADAYQWPAAVRRVACSKWWSGRVCP
jgi:hypothetical protein